MELVIILVIIFVVIWAMRSFAKQYEKDKSSNKRREEAYQEFEAERSEKNSTRSSLHPNDTVLGTSLPKTRLQKMQEKLDKLSKIPADSPNAKGKYLFFDTETTGLPRKRNSVPEDFANWPYIVEIAWYLTDEDGLLIDGCHYIVRQDVSIPKEASDIHHITTAKMIAEGVSPQEVYTELLDSLKNTEYIIAHNIDFDMPIVECELLRNGFEKTLYSKKRFCTMKSGKEFCKVYDRGGRIKNPRLSELFSELYFGDSTLNIEGTHNALADTNMLYRCFMKMLESNPQLLKMDGDMNDLQWNSIEQSKYSSLPIEPITGIIPMILNSELHRFFDDDCFKGLEVVVTGVSQGEKEDCWNMIIALNGKVVKSVTKKLSFVVMGAAPGPKKLENIQSKIENGEQIVGLTDIQLMILYNKTLLTD